MKKKNHIIAPENCTGCALCANVCSKNAIKMVWSREGFLVPQVDEKKCVECGLCHRQCIALEDKQNYTDDIETVVSYGGWNRKDDIKERSSSGGIFTALAEKVISEGGVVFGVVWQDKYTAVFEKTYTLEGLQRMRGSKYTPSVPGKVYQEVEAELKSGKVAFFSGTPCQVHALKKYLRKSYDNLLTVDIVCHGVPSRLVLEKYIAEDEAKCNKIIDYISFRDKPEGWRNFHVTRHYTDKSFASESLGTDMYMRMFLCDKALNYVCYNCPYAHIPRQGDITLGDYWGVENYHEDWPIDKGISAILVNSPQGQSFLQKIEEKVDLRTEPFSKIYSGQDVVYVRPTKEIPEQRKPVLHKIKKWSLKRVYRKIANRQVAEFGPFIVRKDKRLYKIITFPQRIIQSIKSKLFYK